MKNIALVFLGGGAGSTLRFLLGSWLNQYFPWAAGTFSANILGSLLIGLLMGWFIKWPHLEADLRLLLAIGFCGGFTTFSAFALEQVNMIKNGATLHALVYMASSMALGVAAVFLGLWLSRH
ncbi:MAG TPA: fluoride efflux transporter CrcB [Flavobacteriaceae bacterium]|nr:fluoride efflux transporter CrcB [Flavobacteriaceae bacterium]